MRVLITTPWFPAPGDPVTGVWVIDHARSLLPEHEVAVLPLKIREGTDRPYAISDDSSEGMRVLRITYPPPRLPGLGFLAARRAAVEALDHLEADGFVPEVIHAHVFRSAPLAVTAKKRTGAPLLVNEHLTQLTEGLLGPGQRLLARHCYRNADLVCTTSEPMVARVRALGARRTLHTQNPVDTSQFSPGEREGRNGIRAIAAGSLDEKKGHRYLLEALATARRSQPGLTLDLVGDGELRGSLEEQARALGIEDAVRFHGYVPLQRLAELMKAADVHVLPSLRENQPLVAAEAMATGLPTIGTDVGGVPEMLEGGAGVVVPRGDSAALAEAIADFCANPGAYDPAELARRADELHGPTAMRRQWTAIYEGLVAGRAEELADR